MKTRLKLFEIMFYAVVSLILFSFIYRVASGDLNNISIGFNGVTETRCINGVQFVVGQDGRPVQIIDADGKGVACK